MASSAARNIFLPTRADCTAYRGLRGDVVTSLANDFVGIVQNPAAAPTEITTASFIPTNNNLTDLGDNTHEFRWLYLGTGIRNALGDLQIDLQGGGTTQLTIINSGAGVAALGVDGFIAFGGDLAPDGDNTQDIGDATHRIQTAHIGTSIVATGPTGLTIQCNDGGNTVCAVGNTGLGTCALWVDGYIQAGQSARLTGSTGFEALLNGGQGAGLRVTDTLGSVNGVDVAAAATGGGVSVAAYGTDANVDLNINPKGTGVLNVGSGNASVRVGGTGGGATLAFFTAAPTTRHPGITNSANIDPEIGGKINAILALLRTTGGYGLMAG